MGRHTNRAVQSTEDSLSLEILYVGNAGNVLSKYPCSENIVADHLTAQLWAVLAYAKQISS